MVSCESPRVYNYVTVKNQKQEKSFSFQTRLSSAFDTHAALFYTKQSSIKSLCNNLSCFESLLTARALAYWYMDDGTWPNKSCSAFLLCTHAFKIEEFNYLSKLLNCRFDLKTNVRFNKKQPVIYISAKWE